MLENVTMELQHIFQRLHENEVKTFEKRVENEVKTFEKRVES